MGVAVVDEHVEKWTARKRRVESGRGGRRWKGGSGRRERGGAEWEVPPPPRVVEVPFLGSASVRRRPGSGGVPGFPFFARAYTVTC